MLSKPIIQILKSPIFLAVILGLFFGWALGPNASYAGELGIAIIGLIKMLAGPLIFFAILHTANTVEIDFKSLGAVLGFSLLNSLAALFLGILVVQVLEPGQALAALFMNFKTDTANTLLTSKITLPTKADQWVWKSVLEPFTSNSILSLVVFALVAAFVFRQIKQDFLKEKRSEEIARLSSLIELAYLFVQKLMSWIVKLIPLAVLVSLAKTVGQHGFVALKNLYIYVLACLLGLALQVFITYAAWFFFYIRKPFWSFLKKVSPTLLSAFGSNSSLATLPLTLRDLKKFGLQDKSVALGACVATNFNNDGILLYEALAIMLVAQALGQNFSILQQIWVSGLCLIFAFGVAGIPEAGVIALSMILSQLNLPVEILGLLLTVDWIVARFRSVVNVLADMTLSFIMERWGLTQAVAEEFRQSPAVNLENY